ncbi:hypothetical protein KSP40_PGU012921 [Platanthera guangdongensis]|uniref:GPN-loop GTPase n=1 Tax=Platanthera guangdongensis TaxID=2320717 RepID=A0ABR2MQ80_9ASPA
MHCSILYKMRLPLVLAFNKVDVVKHEFALEWMEDFEAFQTALDSDTSYTSTLTRSLSLVLDEFYKNLRSVGVSAVSGAGMDAFFNAIRDSSEDYMENYRSDLDKRLAEKDTLEEQNRVANMENLRKDMEKTKGQTVVLSTGLKDKDSHKKMNEDEQEEEDEEEVDDEDAILFSEEEVEEDEGEDEEISNGLKWALSWAFALRAAVMCARLASRAICWACCCLPLGPHAGCRCPLLYWNMGCVSAMRSELSPPFCWSSLFNCSSNTYGSRLKELQWDVTGASLSLRMLWERGEDAPVVAGELGPKP